jgi:hypothetical protein
VPVAVRPVFEQVAGIADAFCREHLNDEYGASPDFRVSRWRILQLISACS